MKSIIKSVFITFWLISFPISLECFACGSMGKNPINLTAFASITLFLPALILIPVEIYILNFIGGLEWKSIQVYFFLLTAKVAGVTTALYFKPLLHSSIILGELTYSITHFIISLIILSFFCARNRIIFTSLLISTFIPWTYSLILIPAAMIGARFL